MITLRGKAKRAFIRWFNRKYNISSKIFLSSPDVMQFGAYREWFETVGLTIEFDRWEKYTVFTDDGVYFDSENLHFYEKSGFPTGASAINKCIKLFNYRKPARVQVLIEMGHPSHCICCKETKNLTFDHVIPTGKGGEDLNTNGQILCVDCNGLKGSKMINLDQLKKIRKNKKI